VQPPVLDRMASHNQALFEAPLGRVTKAPLESKDTFKLHLQLLHAN
jgi:hypothetical protein